MECADTRESLEMYIAGDLDADEAREVADHLAACEACAEEYDRARALIARIRETAEAFVPVQRYSTPSASRARRAAPAWGWRLATAAALVFGLAASSVLAIPALARELPLPLTRQIDALSEENAALQEQVDELTVRLEQIGGEQVPVVDTTPGDLPPEVNAAVQELAMDFIRAQYAGDTDALAAMGTERLRADLLAHPDSYARTGGEDLVFAQMTEAAQADDGTYLIFVRLMDSGDWSQSQYQEDFEIKKVGDRYLVDFMGMDA